MPKGHFPKKGERLIEGVWVMPEAPKPARQSMTAADRRNWFRRLAGWPVRSS